MAQVKLKSLCSMCFLITSVMILTVMADKEEDTSLSDSSESPSLSESPSPSPSCYPSDNDCITPSSNNNDQQPTGSSTDIPETLPSQGDGERTLNEEVPVESSPDRDSIKKLYSEAMKLLSSSNIMKKAKGYEMLQDPLLSSSDEAQEQLAYGYLFGNILRRNFTKAREIFDRMAKRGIPSGQHGLGLMYSTGIGVNSSQAKAVLYYTFGALGDNTYSQMAMGYRAFHGVATPQNCEVALSYYRKIAKKVIDDCPVFAGSHSVNKMRLTEEEVSVFGGVTEDEVDHYKEVFADNGAELPLGLYYLFGAGGVDRNLPQALELLSRVNTPAAYAFIGRIYAEGSPPDIEQSNDTAIKYFKKAIEHQSLEGYTGLAIMYYTGMGVQQDYIQALDYFQKAAARGLSEAHLYIGLSYLYGRGVQVNYIKAFHSLESAAQGGHIAAFYHLAEIYAKGLTAKRNCPKAVELYKIVSERGKWTQLNKEAYRLYMAGDVDSSLMMYLHLGELGIEVAQCNAAYILEDDMVMINETELLKRALLQWSRSATQGYSVARVKLGDFYYYGKGADQDFELAAEQYRLASDRMASPQAMFNLGYMYENGIGLQKDYDLAKRYYDLAAETSSDALIPVNLALIKLNFMYYYQTVLEKLQDNDNIIVLLQNVDTDNWDIYLIAVLFVVLAVVIRWYRR